MAKRFSKKRIGVLVAGVFVILFLGFWLSGLNRSEIDVGGANEIGNGPIGSLSGENCPNGGARPIAVMLASDPVARPLSGIGQADLIFEMPVTPSGVTRIMAVYQCNKPKEIGSIRSAREDFLPLVSYLDAIYGHWGGEKGALEKLNNGILDNINALTNPFDTYYRKSGVRAPHNGFSSYDNMKKGSEKLKYSQDDKFEGYSRSAEEEKRTLSNIIKTINVGYESPYDVVWSYNSEINKYLRTRGGQPEIDKSTGEQVSVANVLVLETSASPFGDQYLNVDVVGSGEGKLYKNEIVKNIKWRKNGFSGKLEFFDGEKEVLLAPGSIWVNYILK